MDEDLVEKVTHCQQCQRSCHLPPVAPLQPWEWPHTPWTRLHVNYAGPLFGHMFLVLVDSHSKWMEVKVVHLPHPLLQLNIFATHGLPKLLVSDNGAVFTTLEFKDFLSSNGLRHNTSAPYHPSTNGLAERAVQTFKEYLKKSSGDSLEARISRFLFRYRITPHATTRVAPAELLMGRRPRSCLDLMLPSVADRVESILLLNLVKSCRARGAHSYIILLCR